MNQQYIQALREIVDDLSEATFEMTWNQVAEGADMSWSTVYNLLTGTTRFPRYQTIFKLARSLGFDIRMGKSTKPVLKFQRKRKVA